MKNRTERNRRIKIILGVLALTTALAIAAGCVDSPEKTQSEEKVQLPSYAYTNPVVLKAYKFATANPEILEQIPCYCGCGGIGHESLRECFIDNNGEYTNHASFCDICVGEASKVQDWLAQGMNLKEVRERIDSEYGKYGPPTNTPFTWQSNDLSQQLATTPQPAQVDLSTLSLQENPRFARIYLEYRMRLYFPIHPENFNSLEDALKMTPEGVMWARFIDVKKIAGTPLEAYTRSMVRPDTFYGTPIIGMYSADYSSNSWIEMHDIGRDDASIKPVNQPGMSNIVYTRPFVYGHTQNVDAVLKLMQNQVDEDSAYPTYRKLLDAVESEKDGLAQVAVQQTDFSDMYYLGLAPEGGEVQLTKAYNITNQDNLPLTKLSQLRASSQQRGFSEYLVTQEKGVLVIKITGNLDTVLREDI